MKILHLGKFYPILGGVEKVMYDLCSGLSHNGVNADMLCSSSDMHSHTLKINEKFSIFCTPTLVKFMATCISPLMCIRLREMCNSYDIIHIHHPDPMAALALYLSGYEGKVILHWHSDILKQSFALKFYAPLQTWLIERANMIIGTSPVYLEESPYLKNVQVKYCTLPIGIDAPIRNSIQAANIKDQYRGKKLLFSLGRFVEYKGFEYLVKAMKFLPLNYNLVIGGSGPLHEKIEQLVASLELQNRVKLPGRLSDDCVNAYYEAADVFCLSSIMKTEAFAIVQIEAMAYGTPVVACNIPGSGVSWVNSHGVSGLNVEIKNPVAFADAIMEITKDADVYYDYSQRAKARYESLFKKSQMIEKCLEYYKSL